MSSPKLGVVVVGVRQLTPRIREYLLGSVDGTGMPRQEPGAHIELHISSEESGPIVRHYSLLGGVGTWDDALHSCRIAVQRDGGRGSSHIHDTFSVGTHLQISVPKQNFPLDRTDGHSLLIAGGIGITPIYSMLRSLVRRHKSFSLLYAGRSRGDLAYREDVLRLAGLNGRVHLSDETTSGHPDLSGLLASQPAGTTAYVCGPRPMVEATNRAAKSLGWPESRVRSELFGAATGAQSRPFDVELRRSKRSVHVGRDTNILDALEAAGIFAMSDCRRGECGLCALPVLEADGPIDHRDRYLSDKDRASGRTMCICVSRVDGSCLALDA